MKWEIKHAERPHTDNMHTQESLINVQESVASRAVKRPDEALQEEKRKGSQLVDAHTRPEDLKTDSSGNIKPIILSEEERPNPDTFQNIVNFRDIGSNYNEDSGRVVMKKQILFRSGRLDDATTKDLELLIRTFNIKAVIDLRAETEGKMGDDLVNSFPAALVAGGVAEHILDNAAGATVGKSDKVRKHRVRTRIRKLRHRHDGTEDGDHEDDVGEHGEHDDDSTSSDDETVAAKERADGRVTYYVNFAGSNFRYNSVWKPLPFKLKMKMIGYMAKGEKPKAIELVGKELLEPRGLEGLYEDFIDYCGEEIVAALKIMSKPSSYPLLVHCTQGKDRTGLVCALALSICGISDAFIVTDYARTQEGLSRQRDIMVEEMRKTGLSEQFSDAPPQMMYHALHYIRTTHGSIRGYLNRHGLEEETMQKIRDILLEPQFASLPQQ